MSVLDWLVDPSNWSGQGSIPVQFGYHLLYSVVALALALAIAFPVGILVGHTGRGAGWALGLANAMRALPTLGFLILMVLVMAPRIHSGLAFVVPSVIVLVLLAVPPILSATVSGIRSIDHGVIDAARGIGYSEAQIVRRVEIPCSFPSLLAGVRSATLQVVATATITAYVSLQGLGRFIIDGRAAGDYTQMAGGAVLVALLAILLEEVFRHSSRFLVSPGLNRTPARRMSSRRPQM